MQNKGFLLFWVCAPAFASVTLQEISTLQDETLRLKATLNKATVQKQLEALGKSEEGSAVPVVKAVVGVGKSLIATFVYANGTGVDAKVGDSLPGGYRVVEITPNHVVMVQHGRRIVVGFSAEPVRETPNQPNTISPFPPAMRSAP